MPSVFQTSGEPTALHHCDTCQKRFTQKSNLMAHIQAEHQGQTYSYSKCKKTFKYRSNMTRHEKNCDRRNLPNHICPRCQKRCPSSQELKDHLNSYEKEPNRTEYQGQTYSCSNCKKTFKFRSNMTRLEHTCKHGKNLSDHSCPRCQKRCSTAHGLQRYLKSCEKALLPDHICQRCQKRCSTAHGLQCHLKSCEKAPKPSEKRQRCSKPNKRTPDKNTCTSEAGAKQFRCRRCTEVFNNRPELYFHGLREHFNQQGGALQPRPWRRDEDAPWGEDRRQFTPSV